MVARNGPPESAQVEEDMWALVYDAKKDKWDRSKGLRKHRVPRPKLDEGKNPLQLDSKTPSGDIEDFMYKQNRFRALRQSNPDRANMLLEAIREDVSTRWKFYEQMANLDL